MADGRKGPAASPTPPPSKTASSTSKKLTKHRADDEATIKVASKKDAGAALKDKPNGILKLKKPAPKHKMPGNWKEGSFIDSALIMFPCVSMFDCCIFDVSYLLA